MSFFRFAIPPLCLAFHALFAQSASAQGRSTTTQLTVQVEGLDRRLIAGARLTVRGQAGVSPPSTPAGRTQIPLAPGTQPGTWVTLRLVQSPPGKDFAILSPWDEQVMLPLTSAVTQNYVSVVLVERRARRLLEDPDALAILMRRVLGTEQPPLPSSRPQMMVLAEARERVAREFGVSADSLDAALRAWSARPQQSALDRGLAALYTRNFAAADSALLEADTAGERHLIEVKIFRARSLFEQRRYREGLAVLEPALRLRPDDPTVLTYVAGGLTEAADYASAEPLLRRALAIRERILGPNHLDVAASLWALATLLRTRGDAVEAEQLLRRALTAREAAVGSQDPGVAILLNTLGVVLQDKEDYAAAGPLLRRALAIRERQFGPEHSEVAMVLQNLSVGLQATGKTSEAESLLRRALAIHERAFGPVHPDVAISLNNLGILLQDKGDYASAEPLLRRALDIRERTLGPEHPKVASSLWVLATLLQGRGDAREAEPMLRRALSIQERVLGPHHPDVASSLNGIAAILVDRGTHADSAAAESMHRRSLSIREQALGPDHTEVAISLYNLAALLVGRGERAAAEPLLRRAYSIFERTLGSNHPTTLRVRDRLARLQQP
jgi:tetratricopeptide (TPR) repeat protein